MRTFLFLLFLLTIQHTTQAQEASKTYTIDFKPESIENCKRASFTTLETYKLKDYSFLKGIPVKPEPFAIHAVKMVWREEQKREDYLYIYVGLDKKAAKKYVIVDANCNYDFSDDHKYEFGMEGYDIKYDYISDFTYDKGIRLNITTPDQKEDFSVFRIQINPFTANNGRKAYASKEDYHLEISATTATVFVGTTEINGSKISFIESPLPFLIRNQFYQRNEFDVIESDSITLTSTFNLNDTMLITGKKIYFKEIKGLTIHLEDLGFYADSSHLGDYLPALYANRFEDNSPVLLNEMMRNKYVLIDFWGSWCNPCIAGFPKLRKTYKKLSNRSDVLFLGIALDDPKDLSKVTSLIKKNGVTWNNYWIDYKHYKNLSTPHGKLRIESFPTYLLVDKNGKMIHRTGSKGLEEILELLLKQSVE